jgi:prevent-host-death family protein
MRIAPLADVKARLSAYVDECGTDGPIVITRNGKPVAVLLAPEDDDELERLVLGHSPRFQAFLENSWRKIREGKGLSSKAFWRMVEERSRKKTQNREHEQGGRPRRATRARAGK